MDSIEELLGRIDSEQQSINKVGGITPTELTGDEQALGTQTGKMQSFTEGSLDATGLTPLADYIGGLGKSPEELKAQRVKRNSDLRLRNTGYGMAGEMVSLAHPFYKVGQFGRGLAASTALKSGQITNSVATRQAAKGSSPIQQLMNTRYNSQLKNFGVETAVESTAGVGYDYLRNKTENATYGKDEEFNLAQSALFNFGLGGAVAGGSVLNNVAKGKMAVGKQIDDFRAETAQTGGFSKLRSDAVPAMKKNGNFKEDGSSWSYMNSEGKGMHGTKVGDNYFLNVKNSTIDKNTLAEASQKMTPEDVSTFKNSQKATKGEGKKYGESDEAYDSGDVSGLDENQEGMYYEQDFTEDIAGTGAKSNLTGKERKVAKDIAINNKMEEIRVEREGLGLKTTNEELHSMAVNELKSERPSTSTSAPLVEPQINKPMAESSAKGNKKETQQKINADSGYSDPVVKQRAARVVKKATEDVTKLLTAASKGKNPFKIAKDSKGVDAETPWLTDKAYSDAIDKLNFKGMSDEASDAIKARLKKEYPEYRDKSTKSPYRESGDDMYSFTVDKIKSIVGKQDTKKMSAKDTESIVPPKRTSQKNEPRVDNEFEAVNEPDKAPSRNIDVPTGGSREIDAPVITGKRKVKKTTHKLDDEGMPIRGEDGEYEMSTYTIEEPIYKTDKDGNIVTEKRTVDEVKTKKVNKQMKDEVPPEESLPQEEWYKRNTAKGWNNKRISDVISGLENSDIQWSKIVDAKNKINFSQDHFKTQIDYADAMAGVKPLDDADFKKFYKDPNNPENAYVKEHVIDSLEYIKSKNIESAKAQYTAKERLEAETELSSHIDTKGRSVDELKASLSDIFSSKKPPKGATKEEISAFYKESGSKRWKNARTSINKFVDDMLEKAGYTKDGVVQGSKDIYDAAADKLKDKLFYQLVSKKKYSLNAFKPSGKNKKLSYKTKEQVSEIIDKQLGYITRDGFGFSGEKIKSNADVIRESGNVKIKQSATKQALDEGYVSTVDTADKNWYKNGDFVTLNVDGVDPKSALEIDMNSANQMVWGHDIKADGVLIDGQIFMKDGSKAVNADNIKVVTHELIHDSIRRLGLTPDQLKATLDDLGVKYKDGDDFEELLTQNMTDNLSADIISQNSKALGLKDAPGYSPSKEYSGSAQDIRNNVMGLFNNPASGVNKWLSGYKPLKAPPMPDNMTTHLGQRLKRKATSFEAVDELFSNSSLNPWLSLDDNAARMQYVSGLQHSMMNTMSESLVQDQNYMKKEMDAISPTANKDYGKGVYYGSGVIAKDFFSAGKFDAKGFEARIKNSADTFDGEITNLSDQIAIGLGIDPAKVKFGGETKYDSKTGVYTIKSAGNEYLPAKGKKPARVDEAKGYKNTLGLDANRIINENYGHSKGSKVNSAANSFQAVQKYANALLSANKELTENLTDNAIKNIARTMDTTLAAGRMSKAIDNGYDIKGVKKVLESKNGEHLNSIYLSGLEENRGYSQPAFGFNPANSNFTNGYKLTAVPISKAGKYIQTGDTISDGKLAVVYGPADEMVIANQDGVLDNSYSKNAAAGEISFGMDRSSKPGHILVDGVDYKIGKDSKPVGKSTGKYQFRLKDSAAFKIPDGIDYDFSHVYSRNTFASTQKRMEDMMSTRILGFLTQEGDALTGAQLAGLKAKDADNYVPFATNPATGDMVYIHKKNKDVLAGTEGIKISGKLATAGAKIARGIIQAAKNGIIVGRPASYINSYVANTTSLMIHGDYMSPSRAIRDVEKAKLQVKKFVKERDRVMNLFANPKTVKAANRRLAVLEKDPLFFAMNDGGMQSSIRGDLSQLGLMPRNDFITTMKNNGVVNMSEDAAKMIETATLQPNTPGGKVLGEMFDYTEIGPKVALYNELVKKGSTAQEATTYVKMAFPDYNMNLPQVAAIADEFMPFMKFFMNVPRMTAFTMAQKPGKLAGLWAASAGAVAGSNAMYGETNEYYADNGYVELAPGVYKYIESWNNYNISMPGVADTSFLAGIFWPQNLMPVTIDSKEFMNFE